MPKVSEVFPSTYLRGSDLTVPRDVTLVGAWRTEYSFGKTDYVFDLAGESVALRCGPQLMREIAAALNEDDFDLWDGRVVRVYGKGEKIKDRNTSEEKDVIVIHAMKSELDKAPTKPPGNGKALGRSSDMDDDIPF
jgi:hypothetical protein